MGRKKEFSDQILFATIGADMARGNGGALKNVSMHTKISIGSIYHQFGSRECLLAETWIWAVSKFQSQFLAALRSESLPAGLEAAMVTPWFCRYERDAAMILAGCRKAQFIGTQTPTAMQSRLDEVEANLAYGMKEFSNRTEKPMALCRFALIDMPLASVQSYLPHKDVPEDAVKYVETAYRALMV